MPVNNRRTPKRQSRVLLEVARLVDRGKPVPQLHKQRF